MNATLMQASAILIEGRERAHVVGVSNPESSGSVSHAAGFDPMIIIVVALIAALAVAVIFFLKRARAGVVVPPITVAAPQSARSAAPMVSCPSCGASIHQDSTFCPKCGAAQDGAR